MKEIPSAPGYYLDDFGNVVGLFGNVMRPKLRKDGYKQLALRVGGAYTSRLVHRLVAEAHFGASTLQVNHKDGDRGNNLPENLEYLTPSENMLHAVRELKALIKPVQLNNGSGVGYWWPSYKSCSEDTGIPRLSVGLLARGVYKTSRCGWST